MACLPSRASNLPKNLELSRGEVSRQDDLSSLPNKSQSLRHSFPEDVCTRSMQDTAGNHSLAGPLLKERPPKMKAFSYVCHPAKAEGNVVTLHTIIQYVHPSLE